MNNKKKIRQLVVSSLVFSFLLVACTGGNSNEAFIIKWEAEKARAIEIPAHLLEGIPKDSLAQWVQVRISGETEQPAIMGEYTAQGDKVSFHPLIPFTPGLKYIVVVRNNQLGEFEIPAPSLKDAPTVLAVYPMRDTVPENLLKLYIRFSKPMQEGEALKHITLIKDGSDTVTDAFLELQRELWNEDRTMLTLWFDPGRIKRDLQPNLNMGPPLQEGANYALYINKDWRAANGSTLNDRTAHTFVTTVRDTLSPDPAQWNMELPAAGTQQPLTISFHESLDYVLLNNTIRIVDGNKNALPGTITVKDNGTSLTFTPGANWNAGNYQLAIEARLEDLAGNNLNRLFDNDLAAKKKSPQQPVFYKAFSIH